MNIIVQTTSLESSTAVLIAGGKRYPCTVGRAGITVDKAEGDGKTPIGICPLRKVLWRADRLNKPETALPIDVLTSEIGWCEDPSHADYNQQITLPHPSVHDRMTRDDDLYDIVVVVGYNDDPVTAGRGSAIFIHLARADFSGTAGCIGLKKDDLIELLAGCDPSSTITILPPP